MSESSRRVSPLAVLGIVVVLVLLAIGLAVGVYFYTRSLCDEGAATTAMPPTTPMHTTTTTVPGQYDGIGQRLPTSLVPTHYALMLTVYIPSPNGPVYDAKKNFTFDGEIVISINCTQDTDNITLHSMELMYDADNFFNLTDAETGAQAASMKSKEVLTKQQMVVFKLDKTLKANKNYRLMLKYNSHLKDDLASFYRADYDDNGQRRWMAVTQFESTDARRALPCFDEPAMKAVFEVTIIHPADLKALSNGQEMPVVDMSKGWSKTVFGQSPLMSSYLLAFGVGDFANGGIVVANETASKVNFRVWSRPVLTPKTKFASHAGPFVLGFYEKYFNVKFPLKKQDMLALPKFAPGAMENWGLVTYRETELLYDVRITSPRTKERVSMVIAHELAHQWFGDLVTMEWWDDLWLNEAFAEFLSYRGTDEITEYKFGQAEQWTVKPLQGGLWADEWPTSPPIGSGQGGTGITYEKGASVLQMLNRTVGGEVLRRSLTSYLNTFNYGNAKSQDLYDQIQIEVDKNNVTGFDANGSLNVTELMNRWVIQPGYPIINVIDWDKNSSRVTVNHERFLMVANGSAVPNSSYNYQWHIPLWTRNEAGDGSEMHWINGDAIETSLTSPAFSRPWFLLNNEGLGFYRINYSQDNWVQIGAALKADAGAIGMRPKAQLIDDALSLAWTGKLSYNVTLNLMSCLRHETSYLPWQAAFNGLEELGSVLAQTSEYNAYREFLTWLLADGYGKWKETNFHGDDIYLLQQNYIHLMTKIACLLNDQKCVDMALTTFHIYTSACSQNMSSSDCNGIDTNTRSVIYCSAVRHLGGPAFNFLLDKYTKDIDYQERKHLIDGLSCAKEPWLVNKLLDASVDGRVVSSQARFVYRNLKTNPFAPRLAWAYMRANWRRNVAVRNYELALAATSYLSTREDLAEVRNFMLENEDTIENGRVGPTLRTQMDKVLSNIEWRTSRMKVVLQMFKDVMSS